MAALIGAGGSQALASTGCTQLNVGANNGGSFVGTGFDPGDFISFTSTGSIAQVNVNGQNYFANFAGSFTAQQAVNDTGNTSTVANAQIGVDISGFATNQTVTCTPAPPAQTGTPTDSQNLRNLQIAGTQIIASQSGARITAAVNGAIGDAFSPTGGAPVTFGPNGFTANFAAEPQPSSVAGRADEAFAALNYAKSPSTRAFFTKAPPRLIQEWSAWLDVRGAGLDRPAGTNITSIRAEQINVTGGIGRKITPDFLVGIFGGYERVNVTMNAIAGKMNGDGGTIGGYTAWRFSPRWRVDALGGWTGLNYGASAGTASGSFTGSRFIGAGGLTGTYDVAGFIFEPSSNVYVLTEREGPWTDSLGTLQAARTFTVGRVATGAKIAAVPYAFVGNINVSPYIGFYGDWRFSTDNALPVAVTLVGINNGWSGRATGGLTFSSSGGAALSLGGEYGGFGAPYKVWAGTARGTLPF